MEFNTLTPPPIRGSDNGSVTNMKDGLHTGVLRGEKWRKYLDNLDKYNKGSAKHGHLRLESFSVSDFKSHLDGGLDSKRAAQQDMQYDRLSYRPK
jgi:hypothetical protein